MRMSNFIYIQWVDEPHCGNIQQGVGRRKKEDKKMKTLVNGYALVYGCITSWLEYGIDNHVVLTAMVSALVVWGVFL